MKTKFTTKDLDRLKREGKIRDYKVINDHPKSCNGGRKVTRHWTKRSKEKDWLSWNLLYFCNEHALVLEEEYLFHPERKWRADWFINTKSHKVLIEFEGLMSEKSRHTTVTGYSGDTEKYRTASMMGFVVLRYTVMNYRSVISDLNKLLNNDI